MRSQKKSDRRPPRFFSVAEIAAIFGVSEVTIYREISDGGLPAVKIRGRYVVPAKAIDRLEAEALAQGASTVDSSTNESSIEVA